MRSFSLAIIAVMVMGDASAANIIRTPAPITYNQEAAAWSAYAPLISQWADSGQTDVCGPWSPDPSTIGDGISFTQLSSCSYLVTRSVQAREVNSKTQEIRNAGISKTETESRTKEISRQSVGTANGWVSYEPTYSAWVEVATPTSCGAWTPDDSTVEKGVSFTQSSDCIYARSRDVQAREINGTTGTVRNVGSVTKEQGTVTHTKTQSAVGTEVLWGTYTPLVGNWVESTTPTSCGTWLPSVDDVKQGLPFSQTAQCTFATTKTTQPREINAKTGEIRNAGAATVETSSVTHESNQNAVGTGVNVTTTYIVSTGKYAKSTKTYWGYMAPALQSQYAISQTSVGSITESGSAGTYKSYPITAFYYANDGSNVLVFAFPEAAPDTFAVPVITVNGVACTIKATYRQNAGSDLFQYTGCGSAMMNNAGVAYTVTVK